MSDLTSRPDTMPADADVTQMLTLERDLREVSRQLTEPRERECLTCFVYRMLEFGCTGLRWATRYRALRAPRATALEQRLMSKGAGCDCEIFYNAYTYRPPYLVYDHESGDHDFPEDPPECRGVGRGSTQPCELWVRRRGGLW
jgi:hypothetical protein